MKSMTCMQAAAMLVMSLCLAGCGGGGSDSAPEPQPQLPPLVVAPVTVVVPDGRKVEVAGVEWAKPVVGVLDYDNSTGRAVTIDTTALARFGSTVAGEGDYYVQLQFHIEDASGKTLVEQTVQHVRTRAPASLEFAGSVPQQVLQPGAHFQAKLVVLFDVKPGGSLTLDYSGVTLKATIKPT